MLNPRAPVKLTLDFIAFVMFAWSFIENWIRSTRGSKRPTREAGMSGMNNLITDLHLFTGKISRPGANPFSLTGQPSA